MHFIRGCVIVEKMVVCMIYFTAVERDARFQTKLVRYVKGYHLSIEGVQKGYLFCQKWYIKGERIALDLGVEPPSVQHFRLSTYFRRNQSGTCRAAGPAERTIGS